MSTLRLKIFSVITLFLIICGCNQAQKGNEEYSSTVKFDSIICKDSVIDINHSKIYAITDVTYPTAYKNANMYDKLMRTFYSNILNIDGTDSLDIKYIVKKFTLNIIDSYRTPEKDDSVYEEYADGSEDVHEYEIANIIKPIYNNKGILCVGKTNTIKKNGKQTMQTSNFYTFNLKSMERIMITDIFDESSISSINKILKSELLIKEGVDTPAQLIDLGYFNIDNLSVNNNFYLTDNEIIFNYEPYEIACLPIGEISIALKIEQLKHFFKPNSILSDLQ